MKDLIHQNWIFIIMGFFLAILGILIQRAKAYWTIAGINIFSAETRRTVKIKRVAIAMRNCLILLGLIWIVIPIITDLLGIKQIIVKVGL